MGGKASLILVLGFTTILAYVAGNLSRLGRQSSGTTGMYVVATESHNLAVTGANVGLAQLYQDTSWRGTVTQTVTMNGVPRSFTYSTIGMPDGGLMLRSVSASKISGKTLRDTVDVYLGATTSQSFSLYAWLTNEERGVNWITGDTVWGRLHSNDDLKINGSPVFMQKVTTAGAFSPAPGTLSNKAIFKKGYETGVARIELPTDISQLVNAATNGGRKYSGDITVTLNPGTSANNDGIAIVVQGGVNDTIRLNDPTFNGALLSTGKVSTSGVLDGRLTIGSLTNIYVTDNILYQNESIPGSDDMLGLVADQNVIVADNTANRSDCVIDASIFARKGSFTAENYSSGSPRGVLRMLGSIVQNVRGPVGTFSGSSIKTGYSKRYTFDDRLADPNVRPPFYPGFYPKTLRIAGWRESVRQQQWFD